MRKRNSILASLLLFGLFLAGCTPGAEAGTQGGTKPDATESATEPVTDAATESEADREEQSKKEIAMYQNGYTNQTLVGFSEYGHAFTAAGAEKENHDVGIFYFLWLGQPFQNDIYDVSEILSKYGKDTMFFSTSEVSPAGQFHWWAKPQLGYYNSGDEFVIRKHLEMLTEAGVDFLVFDTTNANPYLNVAKRVMKVITELQAEGWDAPRVAFYTHSYSIQTMTTLYTEIYNKDVYPDSWYRVDGKPMIIGYTTEVADQAEAASRGDTTYAPGDLPEQLVDFFSVRDPRWPYEPAGKNTFPYTEWTWPQPLNGNMMSVSIATHPMVPFSFSLTHENWCNWGRGYDVKTKQNVHEDIYKGTFFQSQWETVFKKDPGMIMITGWNEWIALKSLYQGEYMLCDNADLEYSRDAEPMAGGYEDAYYVLMIENIRRYKNAATDADFRSSQHTVDISGSLSQWDSVQAIYRRVGSDDGARGSYGGSKTVYYENAAVDNNIQEIRVASDTENLYFLIRTEGDVAMKDAANWMNLYIGTGATPSPKGWESYEYAVNRARNGNEATVESLNADATGTACGTATFTVSGNTVQIRVPRAAVGLTADSVFYFKVADGVENPTDIMNTYSTGRALPMGRLSYLYQ